MKNLCDLPDDILLNIISRVLFNDNINGANITNTNNSIITCFGLPRSAPASTDASHQTITNFCSPSRYKVSEILQQSNYNWRFSSYKVSQLHKDKSVLNIALLNKKIFKIVSLLSSPNMISFVRNKEVESLLIRKQELSSFQKQILSSPSYSILYFRYSITCLEIPVWIDMDRYNLIDTFPNVNCLKLFGISKSNNTFQYNSMKKDTKNKWKLKHLNFICQPNLFDFLLAKINYQNFLSLSILFDFAVLEINDNNNNIELFLNHLASSINSGNLQILTVINRASFFIGDLPFISDFLLKAGHTTLKELSFYNSTSKNEAMSKETMLYIQHHVNDHYPRFMHIISNLPHLKKLRLEDNVLKTLGLPKVLAQAHNTSFTDNCSVENLEIISRAFSVGIIKPSLLNALIRLLIAHLTEFNFIYGQFTEFETFQVSDLWNHVINEDELVSVTPTTANNHPRIKPLPILKIYLAWHIINDSQEFMFNERATLQKQQPSYQQHNNTIPWMKQWETYLYLGDSYKNVGNSFPGNDSENTISFWHSWCEFQDADRYAIQRVSRLL
ncbi:uncharacterized protein SCDLUD_005033 [Saccharomycodes ludwigii]|uniref:uncharacterized protein n=1 Tax=Saccharomycodes ludwigii TaxID=36035 RepID=UPI001E8B9EC2|nr:hypothetical protein SCDLUD_005033 [Saccharomycodes ludwigii]KAH3898709.1 hypothetical protein SCDLUD_005033 [Saccharomycodes ludwigii]